MSSPVRDADTNGNPNVTGNIYEGNQGAAGTNFGNPSFEQDVIIGGCK